MLKYRKIIWSPFFEHHMISYGIIAYCIPTGKWLLVNRRHSPEFIMLLRGSYRAIDLSRILSGISQQEKEQILNIIYKRESFEYIYNQVIAKDRFENLDYAKERFISSIPIIKNLLIDTQCEETTEWLFPKGRILGNEDSLQCAQREFYEETGIDIQNLSPNIVTSFMTQPFIDIFQGVNSKTYETRAWIYLFHKELLIPGIESEDNEPGEIGERKWVTLQEASQLLKPSKRNILHEANKLIRSRVRHY